MDELLFLVKWLSHPQELAEAIEEIGSFHRDVLRVLAGKEPIGTYPKPTPGERLIFDLTEDRN